MNPTISIEKVYYNKGLMIDILIKGCIELNDIKVPNYDHIVIEKKFIKDTGYI